MFKDENKKNHLFDVSLFYKNKINIVDIYAKIIVYFYKSIH